MIDQAGAENGGEGEGKQHAHHRQPVLEQPHEAAARRLFHLWIVIPMI